MKATEVYSKLGCVPPFNPGEVVHQMPRVGRIDDGSERQTVDESSEASDAYVREPRKVYAGLVEALDPCLNGVVRSKPLREVGVKQPPVADAHFVQHLGIEDMRFTEGNVLSAGVSVSRAACRQASRRNLGLISQRITDKDTVTVRKPVIDAAIDLIHSQ